MRTYHWGEIVGLLKHPETYGLVLLCSETHVSVLICYVGETLLVPNGNMALWELPDVYMAIPRPNTLSLMLAEDNGYVTENLFPVAV